MTERTTEEVAQVFSAAGDSVTVVNAEVAKSSLTDPEKVRLKRNVDHLEIIKTYKKEDNTTSIWTDEEKDKLKRNVEHLETIKTYKKEDGTTSIWTNESFTAIDAAITAGKAKVA